MSWSKRHLDHADREDLDAHCSILQQHRRSPCPVEAERETMTLTVPEAARRVGRNPETIRRWIREGRLRAHKVGTQHVIDDEDLASVIDDEELPVPAEWRTTLFGDPMPNTVALIRRARAGH
ncbi:MAG TPA: helix-turn-helix domain-containing protein [Patescibacteria group bacterium]|nr:helix-turn-helix domain-containing protein [Patescibacteria group bacterium]